MPSTRKLSGSYFVKAVLGLQLSCDGSPCCKIKIVFWVKASLNHASKVLSDKSTGHLSTLLLPKHCSAEITPFPYDIAAAV